MIDETLILRKISQLDEYRKQLGEYENLSVDAYSGDWKIQRIVERTLQMMIEACVDISAHIIADKGFRTPTSYADTFKVMHEESIVDDALFSALEKMAKFRNIVVHSYDIIDAEIVIGILQNNVQDVVTYKNSVLDFLKTEKAQKRKDGK